MILCSACLAGIHCRYDGESREHTEILDLLALGELLLVCPEQLGGLSTPRSKMSLRGGDGADVWEGKARVLDERGRDRTEALIRGSRECLILARRIGANRAILKEMSPSCGCYRVLVDGKWVSGQGVCTALLTRSGIRVEAR